MVVGRIHIPTGTKRLHNSAGDVVLHNGGSWRVEKCVLGGNRILRVVVPGNQFGAGSDLLLHSAADSPNVFPSKAGNRTVRVEPRLCESSGIGIVEPTDIGAQTSFL